MKTKVFNLIILDESGSMHSIKKEAIYSVNETVQTIRSAEKKNEEQEHFISLVTFNDEVKKVYDCVPTVEVKELTSEIYYPSCSTALYDAMGISLNELRHKVADDDRVLVTIVTDGYENASKEYNGKAIKALVDELKAKGWVFAYIGANQDVEKVAATISITNTMSFNTTPEDTMHMSECVNKSRLRFYSRISKLNFNAIVENEHFFDDVQIPATTRFKEGLFQGIQPFSFHELKSYSKEYLSGYLAENYSVDLESGHQEALSEMEGELRALAEQEILARYDCADSIHISPRFSKETYKYVLVPVYSTSYHYKNKQYTVVINGQSGRIKGEYPKSPVKIAIATIIAILAVIFGYMLISATSSTDSKAKEQQVMEMTNTVLEQSLLPLRLESGGEQEEAFTISVI